MKALWTAVATLALGVVAVFGPGASAATVPLAGVDTKVTVTADLAGLGLTPSTFGTASASVVDERLVVAFPITGGTLDTGTGDALIEHNGSGVTLTSDSASATVGNFLIDTAKAVVRGDIIDIVTGKGLLSGKTLFTFGTEESPLGVELEISDFLAGALAGLAGKPELATALTGATFGFAQPNVAPVPVPAAGVLLLGGLGLMGALRARRKAA